MSLGLAAAMVLALSVAAQDGLRVDVRLVNVIATVTDAQGRYVDGLTADDFVVEEDGVRQEIVHFSQDEEIPVSVGIVLDTSGSMDNKIRTARTAVERFVRTIHEDDDVFLMTFSGEPILRQDFTGERQRISRALSTIRVSGGTALYDAIDAALDKIQEGRHDKRALLVITDGQDTESRTSAVEINRKIRRADLLVYSLGIGPMTYGNRSEHIPFTWPLPPVLGGRRASSSQRDAVNMTVLRDFAQSSGGRATLLADSYIGRSTQLEEVLTEIAHELRGQYTLGYYPSTADDGEFHRIRVRTRRGLFVRARSGYLADGN